MKTFIFSILVFTFTALAFSPAKASHMVGGVITYTYWGDSVGGGGITYYNYEVNLIIYEDCTNGSPTAIAQDNPAFLGVFDAVTFQEYELDTNLYYTSSISIPAVYSNGCGSNAVSSMCTYQKTFTRHYALTANSNGYVIAYQRCCRSAALVNIVDPGDNGSTFYCTIPPTPAVINSSAVFKNYPPQIACLNQSMSYDNSATDADGDSLSYGFCAAFNGAGGSNSKPYPSAPPYYSVSYNSPFSAQEPVTGTPNLVIDPVTGIITGTPGLAGRYLLDVYCKEWRSGVLINTMRRESQLVVYDCGQDANIFTPEVGPDTIIMVGSTVNFYASLGVSYTWTPSTFLSSTTVANPVGIFNEPGNFTYVVSAVSDSGCKGTATLHIEVLKYSNFIVPSAFSPNNDGLNDFLTPLPVLGSTLINFKVFDRKGIRVYDGGPNDPGWDGTYKGVKQDVGTYYWELLFYDNTGATRRMKGNATLVR